MLLFISKLSIMENNSNTKYVIRYVEQRLANRLFIANHLRSTHLV